MVATIDKWKIPKLFTYARVKFEKLFVAPDELDDATRLLTHLIE